MKISKTESLDLVNRQLGVFDLLGLDSVINYNRTATLTYEYDYVPGMQLESYAAALHYLQNQVWSHGCLDCDGCVGGGSYFDYVWAIVQEEGLDVPKEVLQPLTTPDMNAACLVHGDATLENFIQTEDGILPIDFGMPRGFCHPYNDIGKLLQCWLTHWATVKYQANPPIYKVLGPTVPVHNGSVISLLTHWIRIVKNAHRHPHHVRRYATEHVIPTLVTTLREQASLPIRLGWGTGTIKGLYDYFLSQSLRASNPPDLPVTAS